MRGKAYLDLFQDRSRAKCWNWPGYINKDGYGDTGGIGAHRLSYERFVGPIPTGLQLDHLCRNRACINPSHLEPVTNRENWLRGKCLTSVGFKRHTCKNGHPRNEANTYVWKRGDSPTKTCRICNRMATQRRRLLLAAAGPDLLNTLNDLVAAMDGSVPAEGGWCTWLADSLAAARAAILKAQAEEIAKLKKQVALLDDALDNCANGDGK